MRVLLIGNYLPDRQKSMQRFAHMLASGLQAKGVEATLVIPPVVAGQLAFGHYNKWLGYFDKLILFRTQLARLAEPYDLIHICDHSNAFYVPTIKHKPHLVTCHDLLAVRSALGEFPQHRTGWTGKILQKLILSGLRQTSVIASVSTSTNNDVSRLTNPSTAQSIIIPNGIENFFSASHDSKSQPTGYLLGVGNNSWYKNRSGILKMFAAVVRQLPELELKLVGPPLDTEQSAILQESDLLGRVQIYSDISNDQLLALYQKATALIFPSLIEGFGWPVIEAQASGCPVITSNRQPMQEVAGAGALYVDPDDAEGSATQISDAIRSGKLKQLRQLGLENAGRFSVGKMCSDYIALYQTLLK